MGEFNTSSGSSKTEQGINKRPANYIVLHDMYALRLKRYKAMYCVFNLILIIGFCFESLFES